MAPVADEEGKGLEGPTAGHLALARFMIGEGLDFEAIGAAERRHAHPSGAGRRGGVPRPARHGEGDGAAATRRPRPTSRPRCWRTIPPPASGAPMCSPRRASGPTPRRRSRPARRRSRSSRRSGSQRFTRAAAADRAGARRHRRRAQLDQLRAGQHRPTPRTTPRPGSTDAMVTEREGNVAGALGQLSGAGAAADGRSRRPRPAARHPAAADAEHGDAGAGDRRRSTACASAGAAARSSWRPSARSASSI